MIDRLYQLTDRYRKKGVIVDANLLMLLLVGTHDRDKVETFKRTRRYTVNDYDLLRVVLDPFSKLVTTPAILAEISNLSGPLNSHFGESFFELFRDYVQTAQEVYTPTIELMQIAEWLEYGLTDVGIIQAAREHKYLIVTDDMRLHSVLELAGMDVIGFSNVRGYMYF